MIEETAEVVAVEGDIAVLRTERQSACNSCSVKSGCGTSVLSRVVGQRSSQVEVSNTLQLEVGERVVVAIEEQALVKGSLLIYLLPLLIMLVAGVVAEMLFAREVVTLIAALSGLLISVVLVRTLLAVTGLNHAIRPQLIRRIP